MQRGIFIFIGPPGAGKGSLSQLCAQQLGWVQLSTGNLCRQHIAHQTHIGKQIDFTMKSGKLISDSLILDMIEGWLIDQVNSGDSIILDGFPRTVAQAQALDQLLKKDIFASYHFSIMHMLLADETIVGRLASRLVCQNTQCQAVYSMRDMALAPKKAMTCDFCSTDLTRRADDSEETVRERLTVYNRHAQDLIKYYKTVGKEIFELPVERPISEIFNDLVTMIGYDYNKK